MEQKNLYQVVGVHYSKVENLANINKRRNFDIIGPGVEHLVDALNFRKQYFKDYPDHYFTVRKCTAEDCFVVMDTTEVDEIINNDWNQAV